MNTIRFPTCACHARAITLLLCAVFCAAASLRAGEPVPKTNADGQAVPGETAAEEPTYNNWIELSIGGLITSGDTAQFKQEHGITGPVYGGIQDLHYEQTIDKNGQFSIDGHALYDAGDYGITLNLSKPDLGYVRAGYTQFRTWYDGNGGFFPVNGAFFPPPFQEMHIDRGEAWVELGLQLPDWPELIVRYSHQFRTGQKDSTSWGETSLTGITDGSSSRKIVPAFRDIDETRDIVTLEMSKTFGNTDIGLGMRYEHNNNNDSLNLERGAGDANQRFITQKESNSLDLFSGHATTETHFSDSLWLTTAYSYTTLSNDLTGSRIYGPTYNSSYSDPIATLSPFDHGYLNLAGTSNVHQWVINLNLMWLPAKDLTILTALRYTNENRQTSAVFIETARRTDPLIPFTANSFENFNTFAETLELRYAGVANWLFYARGEWREQYGDIHDSETHDTEGGGITDSVIKNLDLLWQKYTVGFNWYPLDRLNLSAQYFYKSLRYDNQSTASHQS
ncbi:MAG: TonB-dependent receptor, partial [Candidatus Zixiibacteriota bacterium]